MATAPTPMLVPKLAQAGLVELYSQCANVMANDWDLRAYLEHQDRLYQRELDRTQEQYRAALYNKYGDTSRLQNITVPVVMPAVEAAVTYQTSVFLTGQPLFGVVSSPEFINEAKQLETLIDDQATYGHWASELMKFFRDGFKYNLCAIEVPWCTEVVPSFDTDPGFQGGQQGKPKIVEWSGNKIVHLDMYNTIFDTRVKPVDVPLQGEFAGYTRRMSRIALKAFINTLPDKLTENISAAFESGANTPSGNNSGLYNYYTPEINREIYQKKDSNAGTNWLAWANLTGAKPKIKYNNTYEVTTLYARIIPSDFNLKIPSANTPQIWKLIFVNHQVLIYAERQTNAHNMLPILFGQPAEDGLGYQTKSLATNVEPIQSITSTLWNANLAARRRAVSDRALYDPSRVSEHHINNPSPTAKIPVRPAAYGKPVGEAVYPFPFRDDQAGVIQAETAQLMQMANMITGQNQVRQGQFVKGNKTQREFDTVMGNANGRDQTTSILLEAQVFTPLKYILKTNIYQFQGVTEIVNRQSNETVKVDPVQLRKAIMEFKVSDGLIPSDKIISADTWGTALQIIGSSPQISGSYNIAPMFSYLMKTQGADLRAFEKSPEQLAYEQALQAWSAATAEAVKTGNTQGLPPQPTPEQYGYNPSQLQPTAGQAQQPKINNITNNISNNTGGAY